MDPTLQINERIDVVATYQRSGDIGTLCVPRRMRWRGQEIELTELALRYPTTQGKRMIHVFHMTDGVNDYRLEFDAEALTWTLIALLPGNGGGP